MITGCYTILCNSDSVWILFSIRTVIHMLYTLVINVRGARSSQGQPFTHSAIYFAVAEAKVPTFCN